MLILEVAVTTDMNYVVHLMNIFIIQSQVILKIHPNNIFEKYILLKLIIINVIALWFTNYNYNCKTYTLLV